MFFVVDKPRLQRMIAIVREDKAASQQGIDSPFLRLAAVGGELTVASSTGAATFPATIYEEGVLFIRTTRFRRILQMTPAKSKFVTFQVSPDGLHFCDVLFPFTSGDLVLYLNPAEAPAVWPPPPPEEEDEDIACDDEPYELTDRDRSVVAAAKHLLWKITRWPAVNAGQLLAVAKTLNILEQLPLAGDDIDVSIQLCGPERKYGNHEIRHDWEIRIEGKLIMVSAAGCFYRPETGHDSFTSLQWTAQPGCETDYCDYLGSCSIVDDVMPFGAEVAQIDLSVPGYSLDVSINGEDIDSDAPAEQEQAGFDEDQDDPDYVSPCDESERILADRADFEGGEHYEQACDDPPETCDLCGQSFAKRAFFVDGRLRNSLMWANMCSGCFLQRGEGLGYGDGQLFAHMTDGRWLCVAGWPPDELGEQDGYAEDGGT